MLPLPLSNAQQLPRAWGAAEAAVVAGNLYVAEIFQTGSF